MAKSSSARPSLTQVDKPRGVVDVIEELGFGRSQILWTFCAWSVWSSAALGISMGPVITVFLVDKMHFSHSQRASLSAFGYLGIMLGSAVGGPSGDVLGRRLPIFISFLFMILGSIVTMASSQFPVLVVTRVFCGFAAGIGFPPSIAFVSEILPASHRITVQAVRNVAYTIGLLVGMIILICDDPYYQNMHWRTDMFISCLPVLAVFVLSLAYLRDSPVALAKKGHDQQAHKILEEMKQLNGKPDLDTSYTPEPDRLGTSTVSAKPTFGDQLKVIFGKRLAASTFTLVFSSLTLNTVLYGHLYAFPLIAANETASSMAPAYQGLVQTCVGLAINLVAIPVSTLVSRRTLLAFALAIGILGMLLFAWSGGILQRSWAEEMCYIASQNSPCIATTFGFTVIFQLSVDLYPVHVASTSAGLVLLSGKVGALVSPYLFEMFHNWSTFYDFLAAMVGLTLSMSLTLLRFEPWTGGVEEFVTETTHLTSNERP